MCGLRCLYFTFLRYHSPKRYYSNFLCERKLTKKLPGNGSAPQELPPAMSKKLSRESSTYRAPSLHERLTPLQDARTNSRTKGSDIVPSDFVGGWESNVTSTGEQNLPTVGAYLRVRPSYPLQPHVTSVTQGSLREGRISRKRICYFRRRLRENAISTPPSLAFST